MVSKKMLAVTVGLFMLAGMLALIFLAIRVSGLTLHNSSDQYTLTAEFDNTGALKERALVSISGVKIGSVSSITLDKNTFRAIVTLKINARYNQLPLDTSASIFTEGLLGSNYISLTPGFEDKNLKDHGRIETTHSALVLENLIGQLIYSLKNDDSTEKNQKKLDNNTQSKGDE